VVELKKAEAMHKARAEDYGLWKAAEDGCKKLIRARNSSVLLFPRFGLSRNTEFNTLK
jgi:hypothetical protein